MEAIKTKNQTAETEIELRKAQLYRDIEYIRAQIRQLDEKSDTSSISPPAGSSPQVVRTPGRFKGKLIIPDDFNDPMTLEEVMNVSGE